MKLFQLFALLAMLLSIHSGYAAQSSSPTDKNISARGGAAILSNGAGSHFDIGAGGTYIFNAPWSASVLFDYIGRGSITTSTNGASTSAHLTLLTGALNYDMSESLPGSFLGAEAGFGFANTSTSAPGTADVSNTDRNFYFGPRFGYDAPIGSGLTLGGEGNFLFTTATNGTNVIQLLAALKWWF